MTLIVAVLSGVTIFVVGQIFIRLFLDPVVKLKESIGELILYLIQEHRNLLELKATEYSKERLNLICTKLIAHQQAIPLYKVMHRTFGLPSTSDLYESCEALYSIMETKMIGKAIAGAPRMSEIEVSQRLNEVLVKLHIKLSLKML